MDFPSLTLVMSIIVNSFLPIIISRRATYVDPDETVQFEQSHLDLHCLHRYLYRSTGLKGLTHLNTERLEDNRDPYISCNSAHY